MVLLSLSLSVSWGPSIGGARTLSLCSGLLRGLALGKSLRWWRPSRSHREAHHACTTPALGALLILPLGLSGVVGVVTVPQVGVQLLLLLLLLWDSRRGTCTLLLLTLALTLTCSRCARCCCYSLAL